MIRTYSRWIHKLSLLDRWLLAEIAAPLLFAVAAFTVLGLSIGVMFELARRLVDGLPILVALQLLPVSYTHLRAHET